MMSSRALVLIGLTVILCTLATAENGDDVHHLQKFTPLVPKESRRILALSESGMITAVDVHDGYTDAYHLQFITMEPGSIFLPVLLHTDMAFYVHTGRGRVTFISEDGDEEEMEVVRGDVYRLEQGTTFYVKSHPDPERERLRIHAIFDTSEIDSYSPLGLSAGAYSNVSDLVRGFDDSVLQMGFGVPEETVRDIKSAPTSPPIVPWSRRNETEESNWKKEIIEALFGVRGTSDFLSKKKKKSISKAFNFFKAKPDVKNENGWSTALTRKDLKALKGSHFAPFMVNLMRGSMMGPHWNPRATEVAIVIEGQGVVQLICPSDASGRKIKAAARCQNTKFKVKEGDVFMVPRFHPMAQISYNNETLVFVGFSSATKNNRPQFLAGKRSVLQEIGVDVLAAAFNVNLSVVEGLLAAQDESIILPCTSCAEEMEAKMEEEEEEEKRAEEKARKREEEEEYEREREEEARKKKEEAAAARKEEEEEEERKREEEGEERRREEEEARKKKEEEAAARKEEEEEEERKREEEEEERRREEEEERKREEEWKEGRREN